MHPVEALSLLEAAARAAGDAALSYFRPGLPTTARVTYKDGESPVSEADLAANATLERHLGAAIPGAGWISEETEASDAAAGPRLVIVDPIDGTRAFIAGDPQWSVSVAFVENGRPIASVVHSPALGVTFSAARGGGAHRNGERLTCSQRRSLSGAIVAGPRPLLDRLAHAGQENFERAPRTPSLALRLARAADASFDLAVASDGAHDWDIAAADLILAEAGGALVDAAGAPIVYRNRPVRRGLLAAGPPALTGSVLRLIGLRS
jgi:myo-inositol-1(or 4)-monophosphatase